MPVTLAGSTDPDPLGPFFLIQQREACLVELTEASGWLVPEFESEDREEVGSRPEFVWSRARYRARRAAEDFSKETDADY